MSFFFLIESTFKNWWDGLHFDLRIRIAGKQHLITNIEVEQRKVCKGQKPALVLISGQEKLTIYVPFFIKKKKDVTIFYIKF